MNAISSKNVPLRPKMLTDYDDCRMVHTQLRYRMLTGQWRDDLNIAKTKHVSRERDEHWGSGDISANTFKSIVEQISSVASGRLLHGLDNGIAFAKLVENAGFWPRMQTIRPLIVGLNECIVRPRVALRGDDVFLTFVEVTPDYVDGVPDSIDPSRFSVYREWRLVHLDGKGLKWCTEVFDISDIEKPRYYVDCDGIDVTSQLTPLTSADQSGDLYAYRYANGRPFIPAVLYHGLASGKLFNPYHGIELIEGTLTLGVLNTFLVHCMRDASWPQRWSIGVEWKGQVQGQGVEVDPAVVLMGEATSDTQSPQIGQWGTAANVNDIVDAIGSFEHRIAEYAGISPSDIQRTSNGDARSGYAIALSNYGKREAQRRFEPMFRVGDMELIGMAAAMTNNLLGIDIYPDSGYIVHYDAVPMSSDEMAAIRADIREKLDMGMISPIDAYVRLNPGITRDDAVIQLQRIAQERRLLADLQIQEPTNAVAQYAPAPALGTEG